MTAAGLLSRMDTGQKVSGAGHVGLILWVALFDLFAAPDTDLNVPVADVSIISAEEFAALSNPVPAPPAPTPPAPAPEAIRPPEPVAPPPPPPAPEPEPIAPPPPPPPPPAPEPITPPPAPAPVAPPPTGVIFSPAPTPGALVRPRPRPVDRVAPTPTEAPPEGATIDIAAQPATRPDAGATTPLPEPERPETAPPEATTEIVTEATETDATSIERAAAAPLTSPRPRPRPAQPAPVETAAVPETPAPAEPTPPLPDTSTDIADALADVLAGLAEPAPAAPSGGSLSPSQADALRLAIQQCWNVGALSTDALMVTVTVAFNMTPSAMPETGSIRVVSASGGTEAAVAQAFETARRAIIRCAGDGYGLPAEQFEAWREIEITFNPEGMRLR